MPLKLKRKYFGARGTYTSYLENQEILSVQLAGYSKLYWKCLNLSSKQQITLNRRFSSSKALNSQFFVDIYTHIRT